MIEKQKILVEELTSLCNKKEVHEFEFSIEMWGLMWMPWFIQINKEVVNISLKDIENNDLKELINIGVIEKIKEYEDSELNFPLEISRTKYSIKPNAKSQIFVGCIAQTIQPMFK